MLVDSGLNKRDIFFANGSFSDSNGRHARCIAERKGGRHPIMHRPQKKLRKGRLCTKITPDVWVEMKKLIENRCEIRDLVLLSHLHVHMVLRCPNACW